MSVVVVLDRTELLLWTILAKFESLALLQYSLYVIDLDTPEKQQLVDMLLSTIPSDEALETTTLSLPVENLLADATSTDKFHILIVQGLILELLGQTIYRSFADNDLASQTTRGLCVLGLKASSDNTAKLPKLFAEKVGSGDELFQAFITVSRPVISHLDELGQGLEEQFSKRFGISYADLMGDFMAELIPVCVELGMDRRRLVAYLTGALMGTA